MSGLFSSFGFGNSKLKQALQRGAIVVDVRPANEFDAGHARGSINIPVDRIDINIERLKNMGHPLIICSSPDFPSSSVVRTLKARGVEHVLDGGNWQSILRLVNSL